MSPRGERERGVLRRRASDTFELHLEDLERLAAELAPLVAARLQEASPGERPAATRVELDELAAAVTDRVAELLAEWAHPRFFTTRTLAERLAISERSVRNLLERRDLPSYLIGGSRRIAPTDVEAYLAARRRSGAIGQEDA